MNWRIGDTLSISTKISEGNKERIQTFTGILIAKKNSGTASTISLYRAAQGAGVERTFLIHSPRISTIEKVRSGRVRRAKLYYLRGTYGKKAKLRS